MDKENEYELTALSSPMLKTILWGRWLGWYKCMTFQPERLKVWNLRK
jgi:hypothetical protein